MVSSTQPSRAQAAGSLTDVPGILVGHVTLAERPTGCTVILADGGAVASGDVRGGAPATRETDLLRPENTVATVHAVVLSGGSAFGLDSAGGVMRFLRERGVGYPTRGGPVPIVVGASLFDLGVGASGAGAAPGPVIAPTAECGYRAAQLASRAAVLEGSVGAGAGATVGKLLGIEHAMKGGVGSAAVRLPGGLVVAALVAVNAIGDVIDPASGKVVAGVRGRDGLLLDARVLLRAGGGEPAAEPRANTTLAVVATNARLDKAQAAKVAQMAHDGLARTLYPAHAPGDGDVVFALATGSHAGSADVATIGALGAEAVAEAIVRAARAAVGLPGLPSAKELRRGPGGGER